jgi:hypothetical protein
MNAGSGERGHDGVSTVDRGDAKGRSCGGSATLACGKTDEVSAHSAEGHRHSQARNSAGDEVADHGRQEGARPRCRPICWQNPLRRASKNGRVTTVMICTFSPPVLGDNRFLASYPAARATEDGQGVGRQERFDSPLNPQLDSLVLVSNHQCFRVPSNGTPVHESIR